MSNSASEIIDKVQDLIEKWDIVGLTSELNLPKYQSWLQENAWDLIPPLVEVATEDNINQCPQVVHTCSKLLSDPVAFHGKPKEVIISILEQCEHSGASIKFRHCAVSVFYPFIVKRKNTRSSRTFFVVDVKFQTHLTFWFCSARYLGRFYMFKL